MLTSFKIDVPWADTQVPEYRTFSLGKWRLRKTPPHANHGYWAPMAQNLPGFLLERKTAGKYKVWMSLTAMELQSHQPHIAAARGNVVVCGLGMGMYLFNIIQKPDVERVLVVEKDQQVIDIFERITKWRDWPGAEKITIGCADALTLKMSPQSPVDFVYVDIWEKIGTEIAFVQVQNIMKNMLPQEIGYWGQEFDFFTFMQKNHRDVFASSQQDYCDFCREIGLPLIEQANPHYPKFALAAVSLQASGSARKSDPDTSHRLMIASLKILGAFA